MGQVILLAPTLTGHLAKSRPVTPLCLLCPGVQLLGWWPHSELLYAEGWAGAWHTAHGRAHYYYFIATSGLWIINPTQVLSKKSRLLTLSVLSTPEAGGQMLSQFPNTLPPYKKPNQTPLYAKSKADASRKFITGVS